MTPKGWTVGRLTDFVDINPTRRVPKGAMAPYVPMAAVRIGGGGVEYLQHREASGSGSRFRNGDVLFARITPCAENKKIALVDFLRDGQVAQGSTEFIVLAPHVARVTSPYLRYLVCSHLVHRLALSCMEGTSGRQRIPNHAFTEIIVPLPPLPEQKKIAAILGSVDEAIAATRAVIDQTRRVKQGLLAQLLTRGIGHTRFKKTEIGEIPEEWRVEKLSNVARVQTGIAKGKKGIDDPVELPYLRVANVQDGFLDLDEIKMIRVARRDVERYKLQAGDVLLTEGGDFDKLGRGDLWRGQLDVCLHQNHVFAVRTDRRRLLPKFLSIQAGSLYGKKYFLGCAKQTTNLASINSTQLKAFPMILPSIDEQRKIVDVVASSSASERMAAAELEGLTRFKRGLMQDLLTGRVRVNGVS